MLASLRNHSRRELFHWTALSNLPSILRLGLLCPNELKRRGIPFTQHGYGREGKEEEFGEHVCTSFYPHKGMMTRMKESQALLRLDSRLVAVDGTFFVPGNTARNEFDFDEVSVWTSATDLDDLFDDPTSWRLRDWQAEVWIPDGVSVEDVISVSFRNVETRDAGVQSCAGIALPRDIRFEVGAPWQFPSGDD